MKMLWLLGLCAAGYLVASAGDVAVRPGSPTFEYGTRVLLAIGLYGAVAGIHLDELRASRRLVLKAVTAGVIVKWLLIGGAFWLYFRHPYAFILGLAVTQIDPLSVAHLLGDPRHPLSARGRTILAAWSSFDDPVTVMLILLLVPLVVIDPSVPASESLAGYGVSLVLTAALVLAALLLNRFARGSRTAAAAILVAAMAAAVALNLMLVPAVLGLFIRLPWKRTLAGAVSGALVVATLLLGATFTSGIDPVSGLILGAAAFLAQAVVAAALTRGLPRSDRVGLALAQQNGITAIILALWIERTYPGAVAILGPAIVVVNLLHALGTYTQNRLGPGSEPEPTESPRSPSGEDRLSRE
jgi:hypothetical protein